MAITLQNAENALKTYYLDAVTSQLDNFVSPFYAAIQKNNTDVWGKEVKKLAITGMNGVGAGSEEGALPKSSKRNYIQLTSTLKNLYGVVEISDKAVRASENNAGAFVSLLNSEMDGLIKSSSINLQRMLFGDGTGFLADVRDILGENEIILNNYTNVLEGMIVDVVGLDGQPIAGMEGLRIEKIAHDECIFVSGKSNNTYAPQGNEILVVHGSYGQEITGLKAIFNQSTQSLYGNDREKHSILNPQRINANKELSELTLQTAIDEIELKSGKTPNMIICSFGVRRALQKIFSENKRSVDTVELAGGYKAMTYNGIPIVADRFCPKGTMYVINTDDFVLHQLCDWEWLAGDDGSILKQVPGKPVYTATLVKYAELMCSNPSAQAIIECIAEV